MILQNGIFRAKEYVIGGSDIDNDNDNDNDTDIANINDSYK
jgi:hypothetical protein